MNKRNFIALKSAVALGLLFLAAVLSLRLGSTNISLADFWGGLIKHDGFNTQSVIIYSLRLPRVLAGIVAGFGLALSGTLLQRVTGNELASPNVLGINAGAGFFVILSLTFLPLSFRLSPIFAFFGALVSTFAVLFINLRSRLNKTAVVLSGVAVSALFQSGISFFSVLDSDVLSSYTDFSVGGLSGVTLNDILLPSVIIAVCFLAAILLSRDIKLLCLGDSLAFSLGVNVKRVRVLSLVVAAASAAAVVSFAGLIGFVGLIVPHCARRLAKNSTIGELLLSPVMGGILVVTADLLGRTAFAPSEVSVGIFTSLLGVPFFLYLILRGKKNA